MNIVHALARAVALGDEAAKVGFDWPDIQGVLEKVAEESEELREAIASGDLTHSEAELGDLLFVLASVGRHLGIDPEQAIEGANRRFRARFDRMSADLAVDGLSWDALTLDEMETRWQQAKKSLL